MLKTCLAAALAAFCAFVLQAVPAEAQATRTWVSGVGDDANPCSRTAPCKTFAGAISKTAARGEISVLDPGGFGAVTITKSISLVAEGSEGSILASSVNGIIINAASTDIVHIDGLFIEGASTGFNGIRVLGAGAVFIRDTLIRGFRTSTGIGIDIQPSTNGTRVYIENTTISRNLTGILVKPTGANVASVFLDNAIVEGHTQSGVTADGTNAFVTLHDSVITANTFGVSSLNNGKLFSLGNNVLLSNAQNGTMAVTPLQ